MVGEKKYQKLSEQMYRKVFNTNDPFDKLIMDLGKQGILNVCVVSIGDHPRKTGTTWIFPKAVPSKK